MLNIKEIKELSPEGYKKLLEWSQSVVTEMHKAMLESGQELNEIEIPKVNEDILSALLMWNPRSLLSFFDDMQLYISINFYDRDWVWYINDGSSSQAESRQDAENQSFITAFKMLN